MKIAVLVSGEYRTFEHCRKSMSFLDDSRVDVFFSTWDSTVYDVPKLNMKVVEPVTSERIRQDLGKDATVLIEADWMEVNDTVKKMLHRWKSGFNLIKNSGIKYDYVLIVRPDIFFTNGVIDYFAEFGKYEDVINVSNAVGHANYLNDNVLWASYDMMDQLFSKVDIEKWDDANTHIWHQHFYSMIVDDFKIKLRTAPSVFDATIIYRVWANGSQDKAVVLQSNKDWTEFMFVRYHDPLNKEDNYHTEVVEAHRKWADGYFDKYKEIK